MKITLDSVGYQFKPTKPEIAKISNRMANSTSELTPVEFRDKVLSGTTWCPGVFDNRRNNDNFRQCEVLALDFDGGTEPTVALSICRDRGITPFLVYYSFSHAMEMPKFRMCWHLDRPIGDAATFCVIQDALMRIFVGQCDRTCKDPARMYFGTNKGEYHFDHNAVVSPWKVVDAFCESAHVSDPSHAARNIRQFVEKHDLPCTAGGLPIIDFLDDLDGCLSTNVNGGEDNMPLKSESGECGHRPYRYYRKVVSIHQNPKQPFDAGRHSHHVHTTPAGRKVNGSDRARKQKIDFDLLCARCRAFRDLRTGLPLDHQVTYCLARTLLKVQGGEKEFREGLEARAEFAQEDYRSKWTYQLKKLREYAYPVPQCEAFCPYYADCDPDGFTPLDQIPSPRGMWRKLRVAISLISHREAVAKVREAVAEAISSTLALVFLIKAPPGCGKSTAVAGLPGVLHVVPTHALALERIEAIEEATGERPVYIPRLPELSIEMENKLGTYWRVGAKSRAARLVRKLANQIRTKPEAKWSETDRSLIEYADALTLLYETDRTAVITHERFVNLRPTKHDTVVIDEDVMPALVQMGSISIKDLLYLKSRAACCDSAVRQPIEDVVADVENASQRELRRHVQRIVDSSEKLVDFVVEETPRLKGDVIGFFASDIWVKIGKGGNEVIHFASVPKLPEDRKLIILSATADPDIYRKAFADRVCFTEIGPVELNGQLLQDPGNSYARGKLHDPERKNALLDQLHIEEDERVITYRFLTKDELLDNVEKEIYFHKLLGVNRLEGNNLTILGTPHVPPVVYHLYAAALGYQVSVFDQQSMTYSKIQRNGYEFDFMTYAEDPDLQRIQLWLIEGELIQAVGRARLHNNKCRVRVLSNFILPQSELVRFDSSVLGRSDAANNAA